MVRSVPTYLAVLGQLFGLCLADEPRGAMRELLRVYTYLVREMRPAFLTNNNVARVMMQVLHYCQKHDTDGSWQTDVTALVFELAWQVHSHPPILRLLLQLSADIPKDRIHDRMPLLLFVLRHLNGSDESGRQMRTALVWLWHGIVTLMDDDTAHRATYLDPILMKEMVGAVVSAVAHAFSQLPTELHPISTTNTTHDWLAYRFPHRSSRWRASLLQYASEDMQEPLSTWIDTLWLIQQLECTCVRHTTGASADHIDSMHAMLAEHFQAQFVDASWMPFLEANQEPLAILLYMSIMLSVMEPRTSLARCLALQYERPTLRTFLRSCLARTETHAMSLYVSTLLSRWSMWQHATFGTRTASERASHPLAPLIACMAELLQTPKYRAALSHRFLVHLVTVEQSMRDDPDYERGLEIGISPNMPRWIAKSILHESVTANEFFLDDYTSMLRAWFISPTPKNLALTAALSSLCRAPMISIEGLLESHDESMPILVFYMYALFHQAQDFSKSIPDFDFYMRQRKIQQMGAPHEDMSSLSSSRSACPLFPCGSPAEGLVVLDRAFHEAQWSPPTWPSASVTYTSQNATSKSTSVLDGAGHILVTVPLCPAPATGPWACDEHREAVSVPLVQILDNVLLLEEFMLEMTALVQLRQARGLDPC